MQKLQPFLAEAQIQKLVKKLATQITYDYKNLVSDENPLTAVITLKGAIFFAADLLRQIELPIYLETIRVASYGSGTTTSGQIELVSDIKENPVGRHVLILDEIVDTGHTIDYLIDKFKGHKVQSVKVCSLLSKPSRREVQVPIDYCGLEIDDAFVVGYGLDFNDQFRTLRDISVLLT